MKKALKIIMATLFVLSFSVLGTSCQKDAIPMDEIDEADLVIEPGTYNVKKSMTANDFYWFERVEGLYGDAYFTEYCSLEVTGTASDSDYFIRNHVQELKQTARLSTAEEYVTYKEMLKDKKGYTFNDSKRTITFTDTWSERYSETYQPYRSVRHLLFSAVDAYFDSATVYQSKDGSVTKIVGVIDFDGKEGKVTTTVNRK